MPQGIGYGTKDTKRPVKKRPTPSMLGAGMAAAAARLLKGRKRSLDDKIRKAGG